MRVGFAPFFTPKCNDVKDEPATRNLIAWFCHAEELPGGSGIPHSERGNEHYFTKPLRKTLNSILVAKMSHNCRCALK